MTRARIFAQALMIVMFVFSGCDESEEKKRARLKKEAEDKVAGFHCLSAWDGSHRGLKDETERRLRDPNSFEHIETRITPVSSEGTHRIIMKFRANNGFGGKSEGIATAIAKNSDCSLSSIEVAG